MGAVIERVSRSLCVDVVRTRLSEGEMATSPKRDPASSSSATALASALLQPLALNPAFQIYELDFYSSDAMFPAIKHYFDICKECRELMVTTSCFTPWRNARKTNGAAKVIPAVRAGGPDDIGQAVRVFFFDDNINLHLGGGFNVDGICNLRDVSSGEYVDFSVGKNGFAADRVFRHTVVHHSDAYGACLVQANILDAMANEDYFTSIINKYSKPGEKLIVYADVNGTLVWDDTVSGKTEAEVLMMTMFRFAEVRPRAEFHFAWEQRSTVRVSKPVTLRQLVSEIANGDNDYYQQFWTSSNCEKFLKSICEVADIGWLYDSATLPPERFNSVYQEYLNEVRRHGTDGGVTRSWLACCRELVRASHAVVLNSFGVDSQRVVERCVPNVQEVLHITVNYSMWGEKDLAKWNSQFAEG